MPIMWCEWPDPEQNKQLHQVPVVAIDVDLELAVILYKKTFIRVPFTDLRWARWD